MDFYNSQCRGAKKNNNNNNKQKNKKNKTKTLFTLQFQR